MSKLSHALVKMTSEAMRSMQRRFDAWENQATGMGTPRDKTTYMQFTPFHRLSDVDLTNLYHGDDMAARMVDIVPQELFRKGFEVDLGDPDANTWINEKLDDLNVNKRFADGERWGRLFGGCGLLIGGDDGRDPALPFKPERCKSIKYLYEIDRRLLWPLTYYTDKDHPKLGMPETFMVTPLVAGGASPDVRVVHESRLIIFRGAPTGIFERIAYAHWDVSYLQRAHEVLRSFNTGWKAVEIMLTDGNQAIFKMTGLAEAISSEGQDYVQKRVQIMDTFRSVVRALVIDADSEESFERAGVNFASIPDTLEKLMLRLAAAVQIPVTILMGQSPAGLNATGDSDFRWFYDKIESHQKIEMTPKIRRVVDILCRTKEGQEALGKTTLTDQAAAAGKRRLITVTWPKLWTETAAAQAIMRLQHAQADAALVEAQVLLPEEVALARFRPEGYSDEIKLDDDARAAREQLLKKDTKKVAAGQPIGLISNPPPETPVAPSPKEPEAPPEGQLSPRAPSGEARNDGGDDQPRDEKGRFASSGGGGSAEDVGKLADKLAGPLVAKLHKEGGFTYSPYAEPKDRNPKSGVMVARPPEEKHGHIIDIEKLYRDPKLTSKAVLADTKAAFRDWLKNALPAIKSLGKDHYLGGWAQKDKAGTVLAFHLDISQRFTHTEEATQMGRDRNQIAVWDLAQSKEIPTGGTGR